MIPDPIFRIVACLAILATQALGADKPWPFYVPHSHEPPRVENSAWVINEIDQFVLSKLEQHGLSPAPPASKRNLLRRVTFDLTGLPPSPSETRQFLQDESPEAYSKLVTDC